MLLGSSADSGGSNFLIPNGTFIFELAMFIVVLGIVAKFILPSIQKVMTDREVTIRSALQASDEGRSEATRLDAERQVVLETAHTQARATIEVAAREVEQLREDAQKRGQAEFDRAIASAAATIDEETKVLREETVSKLEAVVVQAAERIIGTDVDPVKHREAIAAAIRDASAEVTP
jgi:F-type H+-transporting ATPase subunit b